MSEEGAAMRNTLQAQIGRERRNTKPVKITLEEHLSCQRERNALRERAEAIERAALKAAERLEGGDSPEEVARQLRTALGPDHN